MAKGGLDDYEMENMGEIYYKYGEYDGKTFEGINDVEDFDTLINTYQEESNTLKNKYNNEQKLK